MYEAQLKELRSVMEKIRSGQYRQEKKAERKQSSASLVSKPQRQYQEPEGQDTGKDFLGGFEEAMIKEFASIQGMAASDSLYDEGDTARYTEDGQRRPRGRTEVPEGEVPRAIYQGLIDRGVPEHVAHGVLLNIADESGFKLDIEEYEANVHGTKGKGLIQFTGARRNTYEAKYGNDWSLPNQLDFIVEEWQGPEKKAYEKMVAAPDFREAAALGTKYWLRPAKEHRDRRMAKYRNATGYVGAFE